MTNTPVIWGSGDGGWAAESFGYWHARALVTCPGGSGTPAATSWRRSSSQRRNPAILAALRGVLRDCWRLNYTSAEDYQRAVDLGPVRGSRLSRGQALSTGDVLRAGTRQCLASRAAMAEVCYRRYRRIVPRSWS
jgi:hypothetical protein